MRLPSGDQGLPLVGHSADLFGIDPLGFITKRVSRFGPISEIGFSTGTKRLPAALVTGWRHQQRIMTDDARFPASAGYGFVSEWLGQSSLFVTDGSDHKKLRGYVNPAFVIGTHPQFLVSLNAAIDYQFTQWHARNWDTGDHAIALHYEALSTTFRAVLHFVIGREVDEATHATLLDAWFAFQKGFVAKPNEIRAKPRAHQARATLAAFILREVAHGAPPDCLLGQLAVVPNLGRDALVDLVITVLFAGYETTASTFAWLLLNVLDRAEVVARLRDEMTQDSHAPTPQQLAGFTYGRHCLYATLGLHPTQHIGLRGNREDWTVDGVTVPAGWLVIFTPLYNLRAELGITTFDPDRFAQPDATEVIDQMLTYGRGVHQCLGKDVAPLAVLTLIARLLREFSDIRLVPDQDRRAEFVPNNRPRGGALITVRP